MLLTGTGNSCLAISAIVGNWSLQNLRTPDEVFPHAKITIKLWAITTILAQCLDSYLKTTQGSVSVTTRV